MEFRTLEFQAAVVAESPPSPLHPALLLNAYLGWASGMLLLFLLPGIWSATCESLLRSGEGKAIHGWFYW